MFDYERWYLPKTWFQRWLYDNADDANLSMKDIADKMHCHPSTITRLYKKGNDIPFNWIIALCSILKVDDDPEVVYEKSK